MLHDKALRMTVRAAVHGHPPTRLAPRNRDQGEADPLDPEVR